MENILKKALKFRKERDWEKFHTPRNLSESLVLESAEVLEKFQWKLNEELSKEEIEELKDELADVFIYTLLISYQLNIDLLDAADKKLEKNALKYPVEKAKGNAKKYNKL